MNFNEQPEFIKEFQRLAKKYRSLPDDLTEFKRLVTVRPTGNGKHFHIVKETDLAKIVKARLFCRYLRGSSLRIVYAYWEQKTVIDFLELYFKGDKENEDRERIKNYCASF